LTLLNFGTILKIVMKKWKCFFIFLSCSTIFSMINTVFYLKTKPLKAETSTLNSSSNLICLKCHKGDYSLQNLIKKLHITTGEELFKVLRKGPKAGLHKLRTDEQIRQAIKYLNLPFKKEQKDAP